MYKHDFVLNNQQRLICHKTKSKQTKSNDYICDVLVPQEENMPVTKEEKTVVTSIKYKVKEERKHLETIVICESETSNRNVLFTKSELAENR